VIFNQLTLDMISPERMTVAIRAYMLMLADLERGGSYRPTFPSLQDLPINNLDFDVNTGILGPKILNRISKNVFEEITAILGKIAWVTDRNFGHTLILDEKYTTSRSMFSAAALMATATGDSGGVSVVHQYATFAVSYSKEKQSTF